MPKEQLIQDLANAYEQTITAAVDATQHGMTRKGDTWGPREHIAHMAGWEIIATVRIPAIMAGMAPMEFTDESQQEIMDNAINAAFATLIGDQSLDALCNILRQAYRRNIEILKELDDRFFQPGQYVYERSKGAIEHCQEHIEALAP